ncbi:MAG: hypothetical protein GTN72_10470 [Candidatus Latescibacteria bacterium]|nr:hypothetical protein [Candidatus Latescibacterota bacterium]
MEDTLILYQASGKMRPDLSSSVNQEIAVILAEGYLRLMRMRKTSSAETGQSGENGPQELSQEQLDSFGRRSDEWELG